MHWHPTMHAGEPGERTMEAAIGADPVGWLDGRLRSLDDLLAQAGVADVSVFAADVLAVRSTADEIAGCVADGLEWARRDAVAGGHARRARPGVNRVVTS